MERGLRIWYEGACYHVMGRGNRHCAIFKEAAPDRFVADLHIRYPKVKADNALNTFKGEYMTQYSWAEITAGQLTFGKWK